MRLIRATGRCARVHPWWTSLIVAFAVAGAVTGLVLGLGSGGAPATAAATTTQTVSTGTIRQDVSASGTLAPAQERDLNFSSSGVVTSVRVNEGQTVRKGQTLATIDSASLAATVAQARATVASNEAKVEDDEDNDASDTQLAADKAALAASRNQLTSARKALAGATLISPLAGVVAAVNLTVGESVSGSGSGTGGTSSSGGAGGTSSATSNAQVQVISTSAWIVNATVDATSVGLIKVGNQAQLRVTGASGPVFGTISSIAVTSSSSSGTASYPVVIAVTGSPPGLHDGADVTATLIYKQLADVVVISSTALHRDSSGSQYGRPRGGARTTGEHGRTERGGAPEAPTGTSRHECDRHRIGGVLAFAPGVKPELAQGDRRRSLVSALGCSAGVGSGAGGFGWLISRPSAGESRSEIYALEANGFRRASIRSRA